MVKRMVVLMVCCVVICGCKKDRYNFTMKSIRLNSCEQSQLPVQNLFLKVVDTDNASVLATTGKYPGSLTLPATFGVKPTLKIPLYQRDHISIQVWGDSSGFIASSLIQMKDYKIRFPIELETGNAAVSFSVMGSWK